MQNGPSYNSSAATKPEKSESAQSRCSVPVCRAAFFPPGLDPVLDRGVGDEHPVVAPQGPFGGAVGQAVLDHRPDGGVDDPSGVMAAGVGQAGHVGVEIPAAPRAEMPGVEHQEVAGPSGEGVAEVVEGTAPPTIAVRAVTAARAGAAAAVAAAEADVGLGQVVDLGDALGGIGAVFAGSWHSEAPGGEVLSGDTPAGGKLFTRVARFPRYRVLFLAQFIPLGLDLLVDDVQAVGVIRRHRPLVIVGCRIPVERPVEEI